MKEYGSHGTSMTRASKIFSNRELINSPGLRGEGGYFWRKSSIYQRLAVAWYKYSHAEKGSYASDIDKNGAIVIVEFDCPDEHFLDLLNFDLKEKIQEVVARAKPNGNHRKISEAYDFAFKQIEAASGAKIKLIRVEVGAPDKEYVKDFFDIRAFSTVPCLISRDNDIISDIRVIAVKDVKEL